MTVQLLLHKELKMAHYYFEQDGLKVAIKVRQFYQ